MKEEIKSLGQLLERIANGANTEDNKVSLESILNELGHRSFGTLLLLAGIITLAPLVGDIPGVPTMMGIFVILTAGQLLLHQKHIWLPDFLLNMSVKPDSVYKALDWLRSPARFLDRWLHPRLTIFVEGPGIYIIAAVSILIALAMPFMEVVPFSANGAGIALTAFGLSLITHDGLVALFALIVSVGSMGFILYQVV